MKLKLSLGLQSNMSHSRIQNKARQITSSQTTDSVAGEEHDTSPPWFKFTVRLCDVKTVFYSDLYRSLLCWSNSKPGLGFFSAYEGFYYIILYMISIYSFFDKVMKIQKNRPYNSHRFIVA